MSERAPSTASSSATSKPARVSGRPDSTVDHAPVELPLRNGAGASQQQRVAWPVWAVLAATAAGTLVLGLWQSPVIQSIGQAVTALAMR